MIIARRYLVRGRVQGVGFRFYVQERAAAEGVHGYVRNTDDGGLEALVEGDEEAVERVDHALRTGPRGARVEDVEYDMVAPQYRATGFTIR